MTAQQLWNRDKAKTQKCLDLGYRIIRLWEKDILENFDLCVQKIDEELAK